MGNEAKFSFQPDVYRQRIDGAADFIRERLPKGFVPEIVLTLGSGGLGAIADVIKPVADPIAYEDIPGFRKPTVEGHAGRLLFGLIEGVPMMGLQGRTHFYELGGEPNLVSAMKEVAFNVYVARAVGSRVYLGFNAAGGLNESYRVGDLMVLNSHNGLFYPSPLAGPQVDFENAARFQPQHGEYNPKLRQLMLAAAYEMGEAERVHEGVYAAVPGPQYETASECRMLRMLGVDAVGMSTVPEIVVATNLGMETGGMSLISNVVAADGTNATSHVEVMAALNEESTKKRFLGVTVGFFARYYGMFMG